MRNCTLALPFGRSFAGVCQDAITYLAGRGYAPSRIVTLALASDMVEVPGNVEVMRLEQDGLTSGPRIMGDEQLAIVLNGGSTPQQWYFGGLFHHRLREDAAS